MCLQMSWLGPALISLIHPVIFQHFPTSSCSRSQTEETLWRPSSIPWTGCHSSPAVWKVSCIIPLKWRPCSCLELPCSITILPLSSLSTETGFTIFNGATYVSPGILYIPTACLAIWPFFHDHSSKITRSAGCSACVEKKRFSNRRSSAALCWTQLFASKLPTWDALSGLIMNFSN